MLGALHTLVSLLSLSLTTHAAFSVVWAMRQLYSTLQTTSWYSSHIQFFNLANAWLCALATLTVTITEQLCHCLSIIFQSNCKFSLKGRLKLICKVFLWGHAPYVPCTLCINSCHLRQCLWYSTPLHPFWNPWSDCV